MQHNSETLEQAKLKILELRRISISTCRTMIHDVSLLNIELTIYHRHRYVLQVTISIVKCSYTCLRVPGLTDRALDYHTRGCMFNFELILNSKSYFSSLVRSYVIYNVIL